MTNKSETIQAIEAQLVQAQTDIEKIDARNALAWRLQNSDTVRAIILAEEAATQAMTYDYKKGLADSLKIRGWFELQRSNYMLAKDFSEQALILFEELGDRKSKGQSLNSLGNVYHRLSDYAKAMSYFNQSLKVYQEIHDREGEADSLNNLGMVFFELPDYAKALAYFEQSLKIRQEIGILIGQAAIMTNIGNAYYELSDHAKAIAYHEQSLKMVQDLGDRIHEAISLYNLSEIYHRISDDATALDYNRKSLELSQSIGERRVEAYCFKTRGEIYVHAPELAANQTEALNIAKESLQNALRVAAEINIPNIIYEAHHTLSKLYKQQGEFALALEHYEKYVQVKEDVFNETSRKQVEKLQVLHQTEKLQYEKDIADNLNKSLQKSNAALSAANQLKSDLIAMASHDLKNPLHIILGFSNLVKESPNDAELAAEAIQAIQQESNKMLGLVNDLLKSAAESGTLELSKSQVLLASLVRESIESLKQQAKIKQQRLTFSQAEDIMISVDANRIMEVVDNLISNAIKYSPMGSAIDVRLFKRAGTVLLEVQDEGHGLSDQDKKHLFERFRKLSAKPTGGESSSGFGLFIVKQLVELHGGKVWAESDGRGKGTTFIVELPAG
jgi:signal transduction histidine kinase